MHGAQALRYCAQNRRSADPLKKAALQCCPKVLRISQLPDYQPAAIERHNTATDTGRIDFYRPNPAPPQLFGNYQLSKWPRRPGKKPRAGVAAKNSTMMVRANQRGLAI